jgi:hypothetical protein
MNSDVADPAEAKKMEANFLNNLTNFGESNSTKHSKAMFEMDALEGRREKVVPVDVQRDIDGLILLNN